MRDDVHREIIALDPDARRPDRTRWFGHDDQSGQGRSHAGRRLRGVADAIRTVLGGREKVFGQKISLPWAAPSFAFAIRMAYGTPVGG
jgi:hypothetical protein